MDEWIAEAAGNLALTSGVECLPLTISAEAQAAQDHGCNICESALRGHAPPERADSTHRFAAYQSERLAGRYAYVCPFTLLHAAAPVIRDDELVCVLVSGPAVLGNVDDEILRVILDSVPGALLSPDAVTAWVGTLPRLAPDEATALTDTLARVAISCCDGHGGESLRLAEPVADSEIASYIGHLISMEGNKRSSMAYPVGREQELLERISAGDRAGAQATLEEIVVAVTSFDAGGVTETRSRVLELVVLISRAAIAGGADAEEVFGLEYRSLARLRALNSRQQIIAWLRRILTRFIDLVFDLRHLRFSGHLSRVLSYVRDHFREPISLSDAAREVCLSTGYLSRIIRSELHTSFTRYLQRLRIEEAKRLLRRTNLPVGDVGARCDFSDHSYFTQLFRKETGLSPTDYRLSRRG
jgi:AraC-like DNA-binding protein